MINPGEQGQATRLDRSGETVGRLRRIERTAVRGQAGDGHGGGLLKRLARLGIGHRRHVAPAAPAAGFRHLGAGVGEDGSATPRPCRYKWRLCPPGGMVDAADLKSEAERRAGSNPAAGSSPEGMRPSRDTLGALLLSRRRHHKDRCQHCLRLGEQFLGLVQEQPRFRGHSGTPSRSAAW
jgi:hypothetical protein